jgi:chromosome segregation ATPase
MSSYLDSLLASLGSTSAYPYPNSAAASRPHVPLLNPARLQGENERLEGELNQLYGRVLAQEEEVRTVRSREEAMRTDLDVIVGERDSLRAECEVLYREIREERRKAETATTRYQAPLLEKNNAIAALQKDKTQLEANISNLREQLSAGSANETDLTTRLKNATAAFQAEQGSHLRSRKESQEFAKALVTAGTRLDAVLRERDTYRADLEAQRKGFEDRLEKAQGALQEKDLLISGMEAEGTKLDTEIASMLEARDQVSEEKYRKLQETLDEERAKSQEALKHLAESWERESKQGIEQS